MKHCHSTHRACFGNLRARNAAGAYPDKQHAKIAVLFIIILLMTIGCGGPSIDASTEDSMQTSIEHIRANLDEPDRARFDATLTELNDILFNTTDATSQATISLYRPDALLRKILHGKSAREVITMVTKYRQEQQR